MRLIILIGLQASGKSSFACSRFADAVYVSKDLMRNVRNKARRQEALLRRAFAQGQDVVVDNTNPTPADRAALVALGCEYGARIIGYYFASRIAECLARNRGREGRARVPDAALYVTRSKLVAPVYAEGFDQLYYVDLDIEQHGFTLTEWRREE